MQAFAFPRSGSAEILTAQQRFSFGKSSAQLSVPRRYRTGWISDTHLGTRGCNATALLDFLRENDFETLYVVGDLIDIWSFRAYAKRRVKDAISFIGKFEAAVAHYAERYHVDAVLCGHIHSPAIREFGKVTYYNCGDWVESCSALVEGEDGIISLVNYSPFLVSRPASDRTVEPLRLSSRTN